MIFNGIEKDFIKVNMELFRPPTPPIEFSTSENPSGGSIKRRKRFTDMTLPVPVTIRNDKSIEFLKEEMSDWLYHEEPKPLKFKQIPDRFYLAEYESMELREKYRYAKGVINFYLAQPYRFSEEKSLDLTGEKQNVSIAGQIKTPWKTKTTFDEKTNSYELQFNSPGKSDLRDINKIKLNYEFVAGDVLEIDYSKRKVTVNGVDRSNILVILQSNYMELPIGEVEFEASHETELFYHERYY
ncbi:MAG TPA: distal tail protein Dit [Candidatus Dormibacteraeota bacterium]|nr:distal tail protein Dit [Candidatus Dormibacteraeota bacterium]